jgi:serine/threonine protein kinase
MRSSADNGEEQDQRLDAFESAWRKGQTPDLAQYLAGTGAARRRLVEELVKLDLEYRWRGPTRPVPRLEDYAARHPELGPVDQLPVELIGSEYWIRQHLGDRPGPDEYLRRFPRHDGLALRRRLAEVDRELGAEFHARARPPGRPAPPAPPADPPDPIKVADFIDALRKLSCLDERAWAEVRALAERCAAARDLAAKLIQRGHLTAYQANLLLQGRSAELTVGPYLLLERLGEGGTGQVFKARHQALNRMVALKLVRRELLADSEVVGRFYREVAVISRLEHPGIVRAYDAGPAGDTHFLVMEYVEGTDLARVVKERGPLPVDQACAFVRQAALGLQHIHEKGLVHRDIKPSNLFLASKTESIKILDLGLARCQPVAQEALVGLESQTTPLTKFGGVLLGTPDYLAPEQALDSHGADIRADVYSLGCTFYYLLTGQPPFPGGTLAQKLLRHQQAEPPPLASLVPTLPASVSSIARRALAKRPEDRYQTPAELAEALAATPRGATAERRLPRGKRRVLLTLGLLLGASGLLIFLWTHGVGQSPSSAPANDAPRLLGKLSGPVRLVAFAVDGGSVAAAGDDGVIRRWDCRTGHESPALQPRSDGGDSFVTVADKGTSLLSWRVRKAEVTIWDLVGGREKASGPATGALRALALSADGNRVAVGLTNGWLRLDTITDDPTGLLRKERMFQVPGGISAVAFAPDKRLLAIATEDGKVKLFDAMTARVLRTLEGAGSPVSALAFAPDSSRLAWGEGDGTIRLWRTADGSNPQVIQGSPGPVAALAFAPDGHALASAGPDGVKLWDLDSGRPNTTFRASAGPALVVAISPDGRSLASGGEDHAVWLWKLKE